MVRGQPEGAAPAEPVHVSWINAFTQDLARIALAGAIVSNHQWRVTSSNPHFTSRSPAASGMWYSVPAEVFGIRRAASVFGGEEEDVPGFSESQGRAEFAAGSVFRVRSATVRAVAFLAASVACSGSDHLPPVDTLAPQSADVIAPTPPLGSDASVARGSLRICLTTDEALAEAPVWDSAGLNAVYAMRDRVLGVLSTKTQSEIQKGTQPRPTRPYAAALLASLRWRTGTALRVRFMNGSAELQDRVFEIAKTWAQHANVTFVRSADPLSDVRVSFDSNEKTSWSRVGQSEPGKFLRAGDPTMVLGIALHTTPDTLNAVVLHEFGHALGLVHELQHPDRAINWDTAATYAYYLATYNKPPPWVDKWVFLKFRHADVQAATYDRTSIMHYAVPPQLTRDGRGTPFNVSLSEHDVTFIRQIY